MDSSAPHSARRMMLVRAARAVVGRRSGAGLAAGSLQRKYARRRVTEPAVRYWMESAGPVQYGLPNFQPRRSAASVEPGSGRSSDSGAPSRHGLQRPVRERVLKKTRPEPRQWRPTRSNVKGARRAAGCAETARTPTGSSRSTNRSAATAAPGTASAKRRARRRGRSKVMAAGQPSGKANKGLVGAQVPLLDPDR